MRGPPRLSGGVRQFHEVHANGLHCLWILCPERAKERDIHMHVYMYAYLYIYMQPLQLLEPSFFYEPLLVAAASNDA